MNTGSRDEHGGGRTGGGGDGGLVRGLYLQPPACLEHDPREGLGGHPDVPERLRAIERVMEEVGWLGWRRDVAPAASEEQLLLVHDRAHVRAIRELCEGGGGVLDADTYAGEGSLRAALHAAGAACAMTASLLEGEARLGFCAVRPPGHHAERARAMGFCLFDNVAIAAELAIRELGARRVFVLDWDVHHGNGTAEIFRTRADVLYASIHQAPLFPGSGPLEDTGAGGGEGYTLNLPVPAGSDGELWRSLLAHVALPAAEAFAPDLILVSAGFDAHRRDPLADCCLETEDFAELARQVRDAAVAMGVPVGVVLEGGYAPEVLAECVLATLTALADGEQRAAPVTASLPLTMRALERLGCRRPRSASSAKRARR